MRVCLSCSPTGLGLGTYLAPSASCSPGENGYPCFRADSLPVILLITDASFHNGPGCTEPYSGISPEPPMYDEAVSAFDAIHAMVIPLSLTAIISVIIGVYPDFFMNFARQLFP